MSGLASFVRWASILGIYPPKATTGGDASAAWPIGSVFISFANTNPNTLLGFGTWQSLGDGLALVTVNPADAAIDAAGKTTGAKTVAAAGSVSQPTFTGDTVDSQTVSGGTPAGSVSQATFAGDALSGHSHGAGTLAPSAHAGAAVSAHSGAAVSAHNGAAVADHAAHTHNVTATGTVSQPTFTGSALANHAHELPFSKAAGGTGQLKMLAPTVFGTGTSRAPESISAAPTANTTAGAVGLSEAKSAGTPAGTVSQPTFTGNQVASGNPSATLAHSVTQPADHTVTQPSNHAVTQPNDHTMSGSSGAASAGTPSGTVSGQTFTGNALTGHKHTVSPTGTVSQPSFSGSATSVVQPSVAIYAWRRAA